MVSKDWTHWLAAKIFIGWGQGITQAITNVYVSEVAPAQIRGTLLCLYALAYAGGQLVAAIALQIVNVVGGSFPSSHHSRQTDPQDWLKAIYSEWALHGVWIIGLLIIPETPWYYARKSNADQAKKVLGRIYRGVSDYNVEREYEAMVQEIERERAFANHQAGASYRDMFIGTNLVRIPGFIATDDRNGPSHRVPPLTCSNGAGSQSCSHIPLVRHESAPGAHRQTFSSRPVWPNRSRRTSSCSMSATLTLLIPAASSSAQSFPHFTPSSCSVGVR